MGESQEDSEMVEPSVQGNGDRPEEVIEFPTQYISLEEYAEELAAKPRPGFEPHVDLTKEGPVTQAAFQVLKNKGVTSWAGFTVATPEGRLKAARWYAKIYNELTEELNPKWAARYLPR